MLATPLSNGSSSSLNMEPADHRVTPVQTTEAFGGWERGCSAEQHLQCEVPNGAWIEWMKQRPKPRSDCWTTVCLKIGYTMVYPSNRYYTGISYFLTFYLAFYLVYLRRFFVVEVRRGTLWSGACGGGPAGNTLIRSLRWRSGGEHSDPELAVEVRRGTQWSWACGGGPAGNTLIRSLRWMSGGEHADPELAVEVRRGTLWSGACSGSPAGNTLILSLWWRSGGEHSDPELAVEVRRGTLWSWACGGGPAGNTAI